MDNKLFMMLKQDHLEARQLMEQIIDARGEDRHDIFIDLSDALLIHLQIEERNLYPQLLNFKTLAPVMKDALREHEETRKLLQQLDRLPVQDARWEENFRLMQQGLLKHMQIEEGNVFEKCAVCFSESQLNEIAQKCMEQKQAASSGSRRQQAETRT